ncbi:MAG TPA: hypothetical protein PK967_10700 [Candidatus Hydrogenedentes bacterium]|mgnify:FL=1|nr:hypothetical protein [Candidatus Hydrogenedentota bacterium]
MKYLGLALLFLLVFGRWLIVRHRGHRFSHWWHKGVKAYDASNWVAAEAAFRECVRIEPIAAPARRLLGATLARRNKLAEAEEHFRAGAQLEPRNAGGYLDLGFFLASYVPDRVEDAIEAFAQAVACSPQARTVLASESRLAPAIREHPKFRALLQE